MLISFDEVSEFAPHDLKFESMSLDEVIGFAAQDLYICFRGLLAS